VPSVVLHSKRIFAPSPYQPMSLSSFLLDTSQFCGAPTEATDRKHDLILWTSLNFIIGPNLTKSGEGRNRRRG
jgi:hypothetical protein